MNKRARKPNNEVRPNPRPYAIKLFTKKEQTQTRETNNRKEREKNDITEKKRFYGGMV